MSNKAKVIGAVEVDKVKPIQSAKPSVVNGRSSFPSKNTCAPSSAFKRLTMQLAGIEAHLKVFPNDVLSQKRVAKIKQLLSE